MSAYIRPLSVADLESCVAVESAAFPPAEAATREKIRYRLSTCPELCHGLFLEGTGTRGDALPDPATLSSVLTATEDAPTQNALLVAHVISTRSASPVVTDEDMAFPPPPPPPPADGEAHARADGVRVGHQPGGKTVALHSLAVFPSHQKLGLGKMLMRRYMEKMRETPSTDRISILTYDRLIPYYQKLGFRLLGKSASSYGGVPWNDMVYNFD